MISVIMAFSMALFLALLAVVIDLGAIWTAKAALDGATTAAAVQAAEVLARGGCSAFDQAKAKAAALVTESAPTGAVDAFRVFYAGVEVDAVGDCSTVTATQKVGRVVVATSDTRVAAFAGAFTSGTLRTTAETQAEWGHVTALAGGLRPLSLCTRHDAWDNSDGDGYLEYLADLDAGQPTVEADLRLTIEVDADDGSPCLAAPPAGYRPGEEAPGKAGAFPHLDLSADQSGTKAKVVQWLDEGAGRRIALDDAATVADDPNCRRDPPVVTVCRPGIAKTAGPVAVDEWRPAVGRTFPIALHDRALCLRSGCTGQPDRRGFPLVGVVRVRLLCVGTRASVNPPFHRAAGLGPGDTAACDQLRTSLTAASGSNNVWAVFRFVVDTTISEGNLADRPWYPQARMLGISVCSVDGDGDCRF